MRVVWLLLPFLAVLLVGLPAHAERPALTPVTPVALAKALAVAHRDVFKTKPKGLRVGVAWAQTALETGRGERLRGFNVGNLANGYARYSSLRAGARAYWRAVQTSCPSSLAYFDLGDAHGAALQLGRCGYYQAEPVAYADGMTKLRAEFNKKVWPKIKGLFGH